AGAADADVHGLLVVAQGRGQVVRHHADGGVAGGGGRRNPGAFAAGVDADDAAGQVQRVGAGDAHPEEDVPGAVRGDRRVDVDRGVVGAGVGVVVGDAVVRQPDGGGRRGGIGVGGHVGGAAGPRVGQAPRGGDGGAVAPPP